MKNQVLYLDEVRISELVTFIGGFCEEQAKFFKYGTDHFTAFKVLIKTGQINSVAGRVGYSYNVSQAPDELVNAVQKFLKPKRVSNDTIKECLNSIQRNNYLEKYTLENPDKLKKEFEKFMDAIIKYVNAHWKQYDITMIRRKPVKSSKTTKTKATNTNV